MTRQAWEGGDLVTEQICTYTPTREDGQPMCGQPAEYEIDFGWDSGYRSLACAEHAAWARSELTVVEIRSVGR